MVSVFFLSFATHLVIKLIKLSIENDLPHYFAHFVCVLVRKWILGEMAKYPCCEKKMLTNVTQQSDDFELHRGCGVPVCMCSIVTNKKHNN